MPRGRPRKNPVPVQSAPVEVNGSTRNRAATLPKPQEPSVANAHVVTVEQQTYGLDDMSTTERLFPDDIPTEEVTQGELTEEQAAEPEAKQPETVEEPQTEEPETAKPETKTVSPTLDDLLELDQFKGKKVKVNVDGEESMIPVEDLLRSYQTDKHLGRKGNQVGEQRKLLAEERRQLEELKRQLNTRNVQQTENVQDDFSQPNDPRDAKIAQLEAAITQLAQGVAPTLYESARQRVANELKAEGHDDFMSYVSKMDAYVATVENEDLFHYYNTPQGAKALYYQLKLADTKAAAAAPKPVQQTNERPKAPIVKVEGGSQAKNVVDDYSAKMKEALERVKANPKDKEAVNELLRLKGLI